MVDHHVTSHIHIIQNSNNYYYNLFLNDIIYDKLD